MPLVYVAEMVADFSARTSEVKTNKSLTVWIDEVATEKYGFSKEDKVYKKIMYFVNILLEPAFT
jgi:phenylpyruvate tautomerase PptA (4-oxalocrotonate tautomerase family)